MTFDFVIYSDEEDYTDRATSTLAMTISEVIKTSGHCIIALSGGSTPKKIYEKLGKEDINWEKVDIFQVDERYVPMDSPESNGRMIAENLKRPFHRIDTSHRDQRKSAELYEELLKKRLAELKKSSIDIVILGMGTDGHSASIFPDLPDFSKYIEQIKGKAVVAHYVPSQKMWRITLTPEMLVGSRKGFLLIGGSAKGRVLAEALNSGDATKYPILLCTPKDTLTIMDSDAYSQLKFS